MYGKVGHSLGSEYHVEKKQSKKKIKKKQKKLGIQ